MRICLGISVSVMDRFLTCNNTKTNFCKIVLLLFWVLMVMTSVVNGVGRKGRDITYRRMGKARECKDEREAVIRAWPCVESGSVQTIPTRSCCRAMKDVVQSMGLDCFCDILISAAGERSSYLLHTYRTNCSIRHISPHFYCSL